MVNGIYLGTSPTLLLTAGTGDTGLMGIDFVNLDVNPHLINVYVVPNGQSLSDQYLNIPDLEIPQRDVFEWTSKKDLKPGDTIYAKADAASLVTAQVSALSF